MILMGGTNGICTVSIRSVHCCRYEWIAGDDRSLRLTGIPQWGITSGTQCNGRYCDRVPGSWHTLNHRWNSCYMELDFHAKRRLC
jgi:hypothetical protein